MTPRKITQRELATIRKYHYTTGNHRHLKTVYYVESRRVTLNRLAAIGR
jgi:hypothetical protein